MKGLLKYLSPFAPDQSGVVSVLYELGGIIVICDAGGCTGNICGFDEPRWFQKKSAVFSAGLRDMDAILGRDELLVGKLKDAADHLDASFAALVGTPVPAVIATDFEALKHMAEKKIGLPVLTFECTGTRLYDEGASEAWLKLFQTFAQPDTLEGTDPDDTLGVVGCTPLDISRLDAKKMLEDYAKKEGCSRMLCYGMGAGLDEIKRAKTAVKNLVVSPAGVRAAEYLNEKYGTPFETAYPFLTEEFKQKLHSLSGRRILIIHQQVEANEMRDIISDGRPDSDIVCGTWFMQTRQLRRKQDVTFEQEDQFCSFVEEGGFEVVIGDPRFQRLLGCFKGEFIESPHFAVSGILERDTE